MRRLGFAFALVCFSAGNVLAQVKNLEEAHDLWSKHFENGDAAALSRLYAPNALLDSEAGERHEGSMAIEAAFRRSFDYTSSRKISIVDRRWREFGDIAIHHNTWVMVVVEEDKVATLRGRSSVVFQKAEDGWWIVNDHATLIPPDLTPVTGRPPKQVGVIDSNQGSDKPVSLRGGAGENFENEE